MECIMTTRKIMLDTIFPPRCARCRRRGTWVCADCDSRLVRWGPTRCDRCGIPPDLADCTCADFPVEITAHRSVAAYRGWLRSAIIAFKYGEERARAAHLGTELATLVADIGSIDGLVPVPLHPTRQRERGFNQAELLARRVQSLTGIPLRDELIRTRSGPHQVGLGAVDRAANVRDAFMMKPDANVAGLRLALVDDVCTTGSTLGVCASVLINHGAREVVSLTLAREL